MGSLAVQEYTALPAVSADGQRGCLPAGALRLVYGHRVATDCDPDAVGQSDYGHLRCHGPGIAATVGVGDVRQAPPPQLINTDAPHGERTPGRGSAVLCHHTGLLLAV